MHALLGGNTRMCTLHGLVNLLVNGGPGLVRLKLGPNTRNLGHNMASMATTWRGVLRRLSAIGLANVQGVASPT